MISPIKCYGYSPVYTNFTSTPEVTKSTDTAVEELEKGNQKKFKIKNIVNYLISKRKVFCTQVLH